MCACVWASSGAAEEKGEARVPSRLVGAYINVILYIANVRLILASRPPARNTSKNLL